MRRLFACAAWGAVALAPVAAGAVPTTVVTQTSAPVQIQSCSAVIAAASTTPTFYQVSSASTDTVRPNEVGGTSYSGSLPAQTADSGVSAPWPGGTNLYATAQSVNHSSKTVNAVVYEFNVLRAGSSKPAEVFYGPQTGNFSQNIVISPPGIGTSSPWGVSAWQTHISRLVCFVAYVRFKDGTDWTSPLAAVLP